MKLTTLHKNEHYKIYGKIEFFLFFGFVKQATNKVCILNWVFKLLVERFHKLGKHESFYQKCNIITVYLLLHFLLHVLLHYLLH